MVILIGLTGAFKKRPFRIKETRARAWGAHIELFQICENYKHVLYIYIYITCAMVFETFGFVCG